MSNSGPIAPKDPTKKRDGFYVLYEKEIEAMPTPEGGISPFFLNDGRLVSCAKLVGNVKEEGILALLKDAEGFRKLVHSIGVSVTCEEKTETVGFVLHMYGKKDLYGSGTKVTYDLPGNGSEQVIPMDGISWSDDDAVLGQFLFRFPKGNIIARINVKLYLNDGFSAPEFIPEAPVDFESEAYHEMIQKSFVSLGNNFRLKKAIEKAKAGEEVTVAFIGGSITQGAGAIPIQPKCYARVTYENFCKRFSEKGNVIYTKAGVGGTPSELGMIRYERDVLEGRPKPDIVVVEFAVNDEGDETKGDCYESLIKKILLSDNHPAVILLFAVFDNDWNLQERLMPIGERYQLPMVSTRNSVVEQFYLLAGKGRVISKNKFFYDMYHPTNDGHKIMADGIDYLFQRSDESPAGEEPDYTAVEPYMNPEFYDVALLDQKDSCDFAEISIGSFTETDTAIQQMQMHFLPGVIPQFPYNYMCTENTGKEPFCIKIKSPYLLMIGKDSGDPHFGKAEIYVDGKLALVSDPLKTGWDHCNAQIVYRGLSDTVHTVEIHCPEGEASRYTILGFGYKRR